jgi:hypothetical protein
MSENGRVLDFFGVSTSLVLGLGLLALGIKVWALVDSITRPGPAYPAAGKLTKPVWVGILAAAVLLGGSNIFGLFGLLGTVAAIVYLVDVRPAVRELRRPGGPWG